VVRGSAALVARTCTVGALVVLTVARALRRLGLIGPGGLGIALLWSHRLTDRAMQAWRRGKD